MATKECDGTITSVGDFQLPGHDAAKHNPESRIAISSDGALLSRICSVNALPG